MRRATTQEAVVFFGCLAVWLAVTGLFIGIRPEHPFSAVVLSILFLAHPTTRQLLIAMVPFMLFGLSYDWMNLLPNYKVNPVDIQGLYEAEKSLFGIATSQGTLTPNEYFQLHRCTVADFLSGVFYLCWVPVPIAYGFVLFFTKQYSVCRRFTWAFLLVNLIGFCGYYIHPAAPPWYVMSHGFDFVEGTLGEVAGLGRFDELVGANIFHTIYARNANVFAAIPSLHSAYMVVTFYYSLRARCPIWLRSLFGVIMLGIWFAAVYSCHHYIIDCLLGVCCAGLGIALMEVCHSHWRDGFKLGTNKQ
ncbi:MAG: inositol phosphorylceramide synthase [Bacteroidaceae bacterium]|nr:inositol phosphorylceramide synthase [Bacteroidaceae bacterium]